MHVDKPVKTDVNMEKSTTLCKSVPCGICCLFTLLLLVSVVAVIVFAVNDPPQSKEVRVIEGDTVFLERIKSSEFAGVTVEEILKTGDSDHLISAYLLPCSALNVQFATIYFQSRNLTLSVPTFELGEQIGHVPIYLLSGSNVTYNFRISTNLSLLTPPEFVVFNNYDDYRAFVSGDDADPPNILHKQLSVGTPQDPKITQITYSVTTDGYYFMTGSSDAGITYQFNATDNVYYLNISDYTNKYPACHFSSDVTCSFTTDKSFFGTNTEYCLIAHIYQPYTEDPPSTHVIVKTMKRYTPLLVPGGVVVFSAIVIVVFVLVTVTIVRRKSKRKPRTGYTSIQ